MRLLLVILLCIAQSAQSQSEIAIGLFHGSSIKTMEIKAIDTRFTIYQAKDSISILDTNQVAKISYLGQAIQIALPDGKIVKGSSFVIKSDSLLGVAKLDVISPDLKSRLYEGDFTIKLSKGKIQVINEVPFLNYLSGVVESEGGAGRHIEYYKVQALMSRTYAMRNLHRHKKDGYQLCDEVHCQAYLHKVNHANEIYSAVKSTEDEVLVNANNKIVPTYFYANCGGETSDASFVWNQSESHCVPFKDTFCIHTRQANWTKKIDKDQWLNYLATKYYFPKNDSLITPLAFNFTQESRKAFFIHPSFGIPLRDLRSKFGLKSTYFDVRLEGNEVILEGHGFGHGVGLCQEGAMEMAKQGFSYQQIALFYFNDVKIQLIDY